MNKAKIRIAINMTRSKGDWGVKDNNTIGGVHNGFVNFRNNDNGTFMKVDVVPLKDTLNCTPVFRVDESGFVEKLDAEAFWANIVGTDAEGNINGAVLNANLDLKANQMIKLVNKGGIKAIFIEFDEDAELALITEGIQDSRYLGKDVKVVRLRNGEESKIVYSENAVSGGDVRYIGTSAIKAAIAESKVNTGSDETSGISDVNTFHQGATTSSKRRPARKARHQAAKTAVAAPTPKKSIWDRTPDAPAPAPAPQQPAPQVDLAAIIEQAVSNAVAPLVAQIQELKADLKAKDAEIAALKAEKATPATNEAAAESVAVVTTPEPEVEPTPEPEPEAPKAELSGDELWAQLADEDSDEFNAFDVFDEEEEVDAEALFAPSNNDNNTQALV